MNSNSAIVIVTYNRANSLKRLLSSVERATYLSKEIPLIISIDKTDTNEIYDIAENFEWMYGNKTLIKHATHLGLKQHILSCGELTETYESVIILEDDLIVSPYFYDYATQAKQFYQNDNTIAGISLYNYQVAESCFYPFQAVDNGSDVYFMQVASSWGQLFTKKQWTGFRNWFAKNAEINNDVIIPDYLNHWGKHSWKKHFIHYLIAQNKFFVFPTLSLTTNCEETGTNSSTKNVFHVPLQSHKKNYCFKPFDQSQNKYDAWFEPFPELFKAQINYSFEVDLYGIKKAEQITKPFVLTSQKGSNIPEASFSEDLKPFALNILLNIQGDSINLYPTQHLSLTKQNLSLRNYLSEVSNKVNEIDFVFILELNNLEFEKFKSTINSIQNINYSGKKLIVIDNTNNYEAIQNVLSYVNFKCHYFFNNNLSAIKESDLKEGDVLSIIYQGDSILADSLSKLNNLFGTFKNTNWIRGIDIDCSMKKNYDTIDVSDYRLAPHDIYNQLKNNHCYFSLNHCFFKYNASLLDRSFEAEMFMQLVFIYQLNVVVDEFIIPDKTNKTKTIFENSQKILYVEQLRKFQLRTTKLTLIYNWLIKLPFIKNPVQSKWLLKTEFNYPFVFRKDLKNNTYFINKF